MTGGAPPPSGPASTGAGETAGQAGGIGIGLAAVLTSRSRRASWQWFATFIGVRALAAYALVVGLCAAIAVAPMLQRREWLFPMPGTRSGCEGIGR
ncbi:hypothetical protein ACIRS3_28215 [Streptomyces virginiae]|uniref:hypothetical protein n=1 Tax=Streptomyces virginiae TaxID=1961 RepID=UPI0038019CCB